MTIMATQKGKQHMQSNCDNLINNMNVGHAHSLELMIYTTDDSNDMSQAAWEHI